MGLDAVESLKLFWGPTVPVEKLQVVDTQEEFILLGRLWRSYFL